MCVVNVSEGRDLRTIGTIAESGGRLVLDVHSDQDHNRSVISMGGEGLEEAVRAVARRTVDLLDVRRHQGVHPRLGALDVVPFAPLDPLPTPTGGSEESVDLTPAVAARHRFAAWAGGELALPCFLYGPERPLPEVRRGAFRSIAPDTGPGHPHPTAGACAVGARRALVAYNLWLSTADLDVARSIATAVRGPGVRALGLATGAATQVSCNLVDPLRIGPERVYDEVDRLARAAGTSITRAELVGLVPAAVAAAVAPRRRRQVDVDGSATFEARLERVTRL